MTKATLLLFNIERLIDLCPLRRVLDHNFTVFIDYVCSANPTKMSVRVLPFMLQLLVYVMEKDKNYSSLFSAFEYKLRGAT